MKFRYSALKNKELIKKRGIGFDELIDEINNGNLLNVIEHHNPAQYPHQRIMQILCLGKVYCVPYVKEENDIFFLKTLYPSRKALKQYLKGLV